MSDITPERVAAAACEDVGGWQESLEAALSVTAQDNVLSLEVTRWAEDGTETVRHFQAVVAPAPAHAVADKPVKLPTDLACELAYGNPGDDMEGWTVVANDYVDKTRWTSTHRLVIRNEQGEHFMDTYRRGLTESQETSPYENEAQATFTPVAPSFKVVTTWKAAKPEQVGGDRG